MKVIGDESQSSTHCLSSTNEGGAQGPVLASLLWENSLMSQAEDRQELLVVAVGGGLCGQVHWGVSSTCDTA